VKFFEKYSKSLIINKIKLKIFISKEGFLLKGPDYWEANKVNKESIITA
jgi:hypothetical protein